jgi:osmoprotectant transport system ATP-binding protein
MIELLHVKKSFDDGASFAVADTSLSIARGELLALIGESGSGKTTTLKMINRLEEPSDGKILVAGRDVLDQNPQALRRNIGYVFQGVGLFPHHSVARNVAAVPELLGWSRIDIEARCREVCDLVGLPFDDYAQRIPSELSGGQQQRVGVARALAARPDVLLMDEPFGALDPITRAGLQEEFRRIQQELGLTVVMVTHDMTEAMLMADRVAVMLGGELLQVGTASELLNRPAHPYVTQLMEMPRRRAERLDALMREEG